VPCAAGVRQRLGVEVDLSVSTICLQANAAEYEVKEEAAHGLGRGYADGLE
jgi:hypothetical protein